MTPVDRRTLLVHGALVGAPLSSGCLGVGTDGEGTDSEGTDGEGTDGEENTSSQTTEQTPQERAYDAENPFAILLVNEGDRRRAVDIEISRNGDQVFDDTRAVDPGERLTVAEYETTGRYTIRAETDGHQYETSADVERENLESNRAAHARIAVDADGVLVQVMYDD